MKKSTRFAAILGAAAVLLAGATLAAYERYVGPLFVGAPEPDPSAGKPVASATVFFVGHSLVGPDMPQMIGSFASAREKQYTAHGQLGWGTQLIEHAAWNGVLDERAPNGFKTDNRAPFFAGEAKAQLDTGKYDVLVMTESNGYLRGGTRRSAQAVEELVKRARKANPNLRVYLYSSWLSRQEFPSIEAWREKTRSELKWWEQVADRVNTAVDGPDVGVLPGAQILAEVTQAIEQGRVPGLTTPDALFADDVHFSHLGAYVIALAQYAVIFRDDPRGLPSATRVEGDQPASVEPSEETAQALQSIVWNYLEGYPRAAIKR